MRPLSIVLSSLVFLPYLNSFAAEPPIVLKLAAKADGTQWINLADPAGIIDVENGITDAEAAVFDRYGRLLVTSSKADGRHRSDRHGKSAHVSLWNVKTGELIWDRRRSRGPDRDGDGHPDDQPRNGEDEVEIAIFSPDGRFVAAGGEDDKIEIWRVRDDHHGGTEWLNEPELVQSLRTGDGDPNTDDAGIDSMTWSHDGRLLFAGTEEGGKVEVFRTQGEPKTWKRVHKANHGGRPGFAVNSLDLTEDDRYVGTVGTDTNAAFWRLDVEEDSAGQITDVNMVKLASLPSLLGKSVEGSGREARFEPNGDRHFIFTLERRGVIQVYSVANLIAYDGPSSRGPEPIAVITNGDEIKDGNEIEPATYSSSGKFLLHDGDTRVDGNTEGIYPGYLRILETQQIGPGLPMPDPIFVQRAQATEFLDFNPDDSMVASGHGDGTVRLWDVTISGSETIRAEAFNEPSAQGERWILGESETDTGQWGCSDRVPHDTAFRGHRGQHYLAANDLDGQTHAMTLKEAWDISGFDDRGVQFSAVAAPGVFEEGDFLRLIADADGDDQFEILIAEFLPDRSGNLVGEGRALNSVFLDDDGKTRFYTFEDFFVELEPFLPADFNGTIRFRVEVNTDADDEEIGFDNLRVTGTRSNN